MINVAIVEDESDDALRLKGIVLRYGEEHGVDFRVTCFSNGIDFISDYTAEHDLVFMDVAMPHMTGFDAAERLRALDKNVALVFVTNLARYAIKGYEVDACGFIVKPVDYASFKPKLGAIVERIKKSDEPYMLIDSRDGKMRVFYSDIYFITVHGRYTILHTRTGNYELRVSMKELEKQLFESDFVRNDNSSMVNLMHVSSVGAEGAVVHGELVPCSRNGRKTLLAAFTHYLK